MKFAFLALALLVSHQAFGSNSISDPEAGIGAESIARESMRPKFMGRDARRWIKAALEGSGRNTLISSFKSISCEPALGSSDCLIEISVTDFTRPAGF